jgi:hypothetical protein
MIIGRRSSFGSTSTASPVFQTVLENGAYVALQVYIGVSGFLHVFMVALPSG